MIPENYLRHLTWKNENGVIIQSLICVYCCLINDAVRSPQAQSSEAACSKAVCYAQDCEAVVSPSGTLAGWWWSRNWRDCKSQAEEEDIQSVFFFFLWKTAGYLRVWAKHMACANHCLQSVAIEANYACWLIVLNGPSLVPATVLWDWKTLSYIWIEVTNSLDAQLKAPVNICQSSRGIFEHRCVTI